MTTRDSGGPTPVQKARTVGLVLLGAIFLVLAIFFVITLLAGDPTDHLQERQPQREAPSSTR
ncbi:hypothetical protein [Nocardioides sp.]|uniref:hypothetical protein n=1 Tax=Nocardioides sp. TaxID=35761 RepID=UPI0037834B25